MILEAISIWIVALIERIGYLGLFLFMALESTIAPIPSEIVMPFAGFLITTGKFSFIGVALISTLGTLAGSTLSYYLGKKGGNPLIKKFGKYVLLNEEHLLWTEQWFSKHGEKTIFISRFIPIVRHLISVPAGIANMNFFKFLFYTFLGGLLWNSFLAYLGIKLKEHWELVHTYSKQLDIIFGAILLLGIGIFIYLHLKKKKHA